MDIVETRIAFLFTFVRNPKKEDDGKALKNVASHK